MKMNWNLVSKTAIDIYHLHIRNILLSYYFLFHYYYICFGHWNAFIHFMNKYNVGRCCILTDPEWNWWDRFRFTLLAIYQQKSLLCYILIYLTLPHWNAKHMFFFLLCCCCRMTLKFVIICFCFFFVFIQVLSKSDCIAYDLFVSSITYIVNI